MKPSIEEEWRAAFSKQVIEAMGLPGRIKLEDQTLVLVGSYDSSSTFPYSFFKWWRLDTNTGTFTQV